MIGVSKEVSFEAAHRLRFHEGACRNVHGHSYCAVVHVNGTKGSEDDVETSGPGTGMILDFGKVKAAINTVLVTGLDYPDGKPRVPFDHALILNEHDPLLPKMRAASEELDPLHPLRLLVMVEEPTAENMAKLIASLVQMVLGDSFFVSRCELWETATSCATWEV